MGWLFTTLTNVWAPLTQRKQAWPVSIAGTLGACAHRSSIEVSVNDSPNAVLSPRNCDRETVRKPLLPWFRLR